MFPAIIRLKCTQNAITHTTQTSLRVIQHVKNGQEIPRNCHKMAANQLKDCRVTHLLICIETYVEQS